MDGSGRLVAFSAREKIQIQLARPRRRESGVRSQGRFLGGIPTQPEGAGEAKDWEAVKSPGGLDLYGARGATPVLKRFREVSASDRRKDDRKRQGRYHTAGSFPRSEADRGFFGPALGQSLIPLPIREVVAPWTQKNPWTVRQIETPRFASRVRARAQRAGSGPTEEEIPTLRVPFA
jgi:hypothetical protein